MGAKINGDYIGDLKCWPFSRVRLRGVWVVDLEASQFFPNATTVRETAKMKPRIWLETNLLQRSPWLEAGQGSPPRAYLADAEGRVSQCDAWFGHLGQYPREFIVERFQSLKPLPVDAR